MRLHLCNLGLGFLMLDNPQTVDYWQCDFINLLIVLLMSVCLQNHFSFTLTFIQVDSKHDPCVP